MATIVTRARGAFLAGSMLVTAGLTGCGDDNSQEPDYQIVALPAGVEPSTTPQVGVEPGTTQGLAVEPGTTQQLAVSDEAEVVWGIDESGTPAAGSFQFPLKVSADGRYLVDQDDARGASTPTRPG